MSKVQQNFYTTKYFVFNNIKLLTCFLLIIFALVFHNIINQLQTSQSKSDDVFVLYCISNGLSKEECFKTSLKHNKDITQHHLLMQNYCIKKSLNLFDENFIKTTEYCNLLIRGNMIMDILDKDWYKPEP